MSAYCLRLTQIHTNILHTCLYTTSDRTHRHTVYIYEIGDPALLTALIILTVSNTTYEQTIIYVKTN